MLMHWNRERLEYLLHWLPQMANEVDNGDADAKEYEALYNEMLSLSKEFTNGN